jgi:predicted nucleotidyltransferase
MKNKKLPGFVTNRAAIAFFQTKVGRLASNWVLQGMLYMNPAEAALKLMTDVILTATFLALHGSTSEPLAWVTALVSAHTVNWIINGQPVALLFHLDWGRKDAARFIGYVEGLHRRLQGQGYIAGAASFGSLSTGKYGERSDIDIRLVLSREPLDRMRAVIFCFKERFRALLFLFPLDLYAFDLHELKRKMKADEVPVVFWDPENHIRTAYAQTLPFKVFQARFRREVLGEETE